MRDAKGAQLDLERRQQLGIDKYAYISRDREAKESLRSALVNRGMDPWILRLMQRRLTRFLEQSILTHVLISLMDRQTEDLRSGHESEVQECVSSVIVMPPLMHEPVCVPYFRDLALVCLLSSVVCLVVFTRETCCGR